MTPLEIIKYLVEHLEGTPYEPWVNCLLFLLLLTATGSAISLLLGKNGRAIILKIVLRGISATKNQKGYAPHWETIRLRVEPYLDFIQSLYLAFLGLYSATIVALALILGSKNAPWWGIVIAVIWLLVSFYYMRINLESASWAHHKIRKSRS